MTNDGIVLYSSAPESGARLVQAQRQRVGAGRRLHLVLRLQHAFWSFSRQPAAVSSLTCCLAVRMRPHLHHQLDCSRCTLQQMQGLLTISDQGTKKSDTAAAR
jgi:hypothetical protein